MVDALASLTEHDVAVWLDDLSRDRLQSGQLAKLIEERHVVGVTSNPTIFQKAVSSSREYDAQLDDLALRGVAVEEAVRSVTTADVRHACDVLAPVYRSSAGVDGRVSLEVDPRLAHDTERTVAEARALWWLVDRPNLFIKIPATMAGLPAITRCLAEGISVNVTLIFSLERYRQVMESFFAGIEEARDSGRELADIGSVASFFVSRVDSEIDARLEAIGSSRAEELRGRAGLANARQAYADYQELFASDRWQALAEAGARPQRPLWASTSVKDPSYSETKYVEGLALPGTVNTMPEDTLEATAQSTLGADPAMQADTARAILSDLNDVGIDYDDVVELLEREGVEKFENSWVELIEAVEAELAKRKG